MTDFEFMHNVRWDVNELRNRYVEKLDEDDTQPAYRFLEEYFLDVNEVIDSYLASSVTKIHRIDYQKYATKYRLLHNRQQIEIKAKVRKIYPHMLEIAEDVREVMLQKIFEVDILNPHMLEIAEDVREVMLGEGKKNRTSRGIHIVDEFDNICEFLKEYRNK